MNESYFRELGQPDGSQIDRLPVWAAMWVQSLKYDVIEAYHRAHGRYVEFPGRRRLTRAEEAECQDKINDLPVWASEWIYTLRFEAWWQSQQKRRQQMTPVATAATSKRTTLFD